MEILRTATLPQFREGQAAQMIDEALTQVFMDIDDRPNLKKPREVTIKMKFTPTEDIDEVDIEIQAGAKIPAQFMTRRVKTVKRSRGFGFELDTDSVSHHPDQQQFSHPENDNGVEPA